MENNTPTPPPPRDMGWPASIGAVLIIVFAGIALVSIGPEQPQNKTSEGFSADLRRAEPALPVWVYSAHNDTVRQQVNRIACIGATEPLRLSYPYGDATAELCMRSGSLGNDVFVQLSDGQIVCRSYMNCRVPIRVGADKMKLFDGMEPTDFSVQTLFLTPSAQLRDAMKNGDEIALELPVYRHGNQQMTFKTVGFNRERWDSMADQP